MDKPNKSKEYLSTANLVSLKVVDRPFSKFGFDVCQAYKAYPSKIEGFNLPSSPDLVLLEGIYVTSGINSNRDVFLPSEMLKSFSTAIMKPINIEHVVEENSSLVRELNNRSISLVNSNNTIIGCIYDAAFLDTKTNTLLAASEMRRLQENNLPLPFDLETIDQDFLDEDNKYHIIIAGVLWKFVFPETIADIVDHINFGYSALSMETFFLDYDYLVDGEIQTEYDQYQSLLENGTVVGAHPVGRVIRQPLFGGVGLTETPANPNAFDFINVHASELKNTSAKIQYSCASIITTPGGGQNKKHDTGESVEMEQLTELIQTNANLVAGTTQLNSKLSTAEDKLNKTEASLKEATSKIDELNKSTAADKALVKDQSDEIADLKEKLANSEKELKAAQASVTEVTTRLETAEKTVKDMEPMKTKAEALEQELNSIKSAELVKTRKEALTTANVLLDDDTDEKIAALSDEDFTSVFNARKTIADKALASVDNKNKNTNSLSGLFMNKSADKDANTLLATASNKNTDDSIKTTRALMALLD